MRKHDGWNVWIWHRWHVQASTCTKFTLIRPPTPCQKKAGERSGDTGNDGLRAQSADWQTEIFTQVNIEGPEWALECGRWHEVRGSDGYFVAGAAAGGGPSWRIHVVCVINWFSDAKEIAALVAYFGLSFAGKVASVASPTRKTLKSRDRFS